MSENRTGREKIMNRPRRKIAAGWTFAAGTLFGVLAAFVLPEALHGSRGVSGPVQAGVTLAAPSADLAPVVDTDVPAAAARPEAGSPAKTEKPKTQSSTKNTKSPDHSELELQLD
jgi:hypothetical protein